ncbi:6715_t:CDS:2, partial [Funneliformis caledonium]
QVIEISEMARPKKILPISEENSSSTSQIASAKADNDDDEYFYSEDGEVKGANEEVSKNQKLVFCRLPDHHHFSRHFGNVASPRLFQPAESRRSILIKIGLVDVDIFAFLDRYGKSDPPWSFEPQEIT